MLNQSNIETAHNLGKEGTWDFNCWGATMFALNQTPCLEWWGRDEMQEFLDDKTELVEGKPIKGDILVMYDDYENGLVHTAVYLGDGIYFHKCGSGKSRFESEADVLESYSYTEYQYRRLIK